MNYGEKLAYWYLRLNGFFPLENFVVHRSEGVEHRSDVDVLAIRMPDVFEPVGGQAADWDPYLTDHLNFSAPIGVFCEVKTGAFDPSTLFRRERLYYALARTGLFPQADLGRLVGELAEASACQSLVGALAAKLFVSQEQTAGPFLVRTIPQLRAFLEERVRRHDYEKYASRMFFPSALLQDLIDRVHHEQLGT